MTDKYPVFEMKMGEAERKVMVVKFAEQIYENVEDPTQRVETFESRNWDRV